MRGTMMPPIEMPADKMPIAIPRRLRKWRGTTRYTVVVDMPAEIAEEKGGRLTSYCSRRLTNNDSEDDTEMGFRA